MAEESEQEDEDDLGVQETEPDVDVDKLIDSDQAVKVIEEPVPILKEGLSHANPNTKALDAKTLNFKALKSSFAQ